MIGVMKTSQNLYQNVYHFVPMQDFTNESDLNWSLGIREIDKQLYDKYGLNKEEKEFIEKKIKELEME